HSGYLLGAGDVPTDGAVSLRFRIYVNAGDAGAAWDSGAGGCAVTARAGYYAVVLGADCGGALTTAELPAGATRWLEVQVGTTALAPRVALVAAAGASEAVNALGLEGHAAAYFAKTTDLAGLVHASGTPTANGALVMDATAAGAA